jgi:hypothetical protein
MRATAAPAGALAVLVKERWLPVVGFEGLYEVSDQGRVQSLPRTVAHYCGGLRLFPGRVLIQTARKKDGYVQVPLSKAGHVKRAYVHQLVANAFHGVRPEGRDAAHHNGNKADNRAVNVRWKTRAENSLDRIRHGTIAHGERHGMSRFTVQGVLLARRLKLRGMSERKIALRVGVSCWTLHDMLKGRTWVRV